MQRTLVSEDSATTKALDYIPEHWQALTLYLDDERVLIDNN
jgi:hypothetical protein